MDLERGPRLIWIKNIADLLDVDIQGVNECEALNRIHTRVNIIVRQLPNAHKCTFVVDGDIARCVGCSSTRPKAP
jgi:hypothetical protein